MTMTREEWLRNVAHIEVLIENYGVNNAFGAFLEALQSIEKEHGEDYGEEFYESQEYRNLQHYQQVIEHVMAAGGARKVAMDRLKEHIKELTEMPELLKEQA